MPASDRTSAHDPDEQLARLRSLCRLRSIAIYREQALYLQILRDELEPALRQAMFSLISETDPLRFSQLPEANRTRFHAAVQRLINRCSVLLTVEQQMHLAGQMQKEQLRRHTRASQQMLQELSEAAEQQAGETDQHPMPAPGPARGSVELSLIPPLDQPQRFGFPPRPAHQQQPPSQQQPPQQQPPQQQPAQQQPSPPDRGDAESSAEQGDMDVLRSLFQLAGEALQQQVGSAAVPLPGGGEGASADNANLLPTMPDALLQWMEAMDLALARRLRNLSHAVNVQLLRSGLAQTLLPVTLLEAVLTGQIETQSAPSNLLRLRLPLAMGDLDPGMDVLCLLLRSSEFEFDSHRLRRCRRRLRDQHRELLKMVRQQRHWERRCLDREARNPWQTSFDPSPQTPGD